MNSKALETTEREEVIAVLAKVLNLDDGDSPYWWDPKPNDVLEEVQRVFYKLKGWKEK